MEHKSNHAHENVNFEEDEKEQEQGSCEANGKTSQSKQGVVDHF